MGLSPTYNTMKDSVLKKWGEPTHVTMVVPTELPSGEIPAPSASRATDTQTSLDKITTGLGQEWMFLETLYRIYSTAGYNIAHVDVTAQRRDGFATLSQVYQSRLHNSKTSLRPAVISTAGSGPIGLFSSL